MNGFEIAVQALSNLIISINLTDDEEMDPDVATSLLEPVSAILDGMDKEGMTKFADLVVRYAETEPNDIRKQALLDLPEILGFLD
ncbi:hypothetical protein BZB76_1516 [Actinomadura pelletieri DSM 43383]|uniref:Uncharacterized protein n=1 Tax=Actinomadura pelletieri DSM 43383 TaxID=1120940 RepID=A0A495QRP6_9ACTN|nr:MULTISPECIES: hypothetical protein [Actinomadura]RKS76166.1 hypothetical protein BZB76_1516 [Actinomadura pelletieri DSM 43383]